MYLQGWTIHATPPRITCPTANMEEQVALVTTRNLGPTNSVAGIKNKMCVFGYSECSTVKKFLFLKVYTYTNF